MKDKGPSEDITKLSIDEVAQQLRAQHLELYTQIQTSELEDLPWRAQKTAHLSPNLSNLIANANQISFKVRDEIILAQSPQEMEAHFKFFVKLMNECKKLNNYHAMMAIYAGLNNASLQRLHDSILQKHPMTHKVFKEIGKLVSPLGNYKNLRRQMQNKDAYVPFIGLLTRDILFADTVIDKTVNAIENLSKKPQLNQEELKHLEKQQKGLEISQNALDKIINSFDKQRRKAKRKLELINPSQSFQIGVWPQGALLTEQEAYEQSLKIYPKKTAAIPWAQELKEKIVSSAQKLKKQLHLAKNQTMDIANITKIEEQQRKDLAKKFFPAPPFEPKVALLFDELIDTEENYVTKIFDLVNARHAIFEVYSTIKPKSNEITYAECKEMLDRFNTIRVIQVRLLEAFKKTPDPKAWIAILSKLQTVYTEHALWYEKILNKKFPEKIENIRFKNRERINTYIIEPIQRGPRYTMLVEAMIKKIGKENPQYNEFQEFIEYTQLFNKSIDFQVLKKERDKIMKKEGIKNDMIDKFIIHKNEMKIIKSQQDQLLNKAKTKNARDLNREDKQLYEQLQSKLDKAAKGFVAKEAILNNLIKIREKIEQAEPVITALQKKFSSINKVKTKREVKTPTQQVKVTPQTTFASSRPSFTPSHHAMMKGRATLQRETKVTLPTKEVTEITGQVKQALAIDGAMDARIAVLRKHHHHFLNDNNYAVYQNQFSNSPFQVFTNMMQEKKDLIELLSIIQFITNGVRQECQQASTVSPELKAKLMAFEQLQTMLSSLSIHEKNKSNYSSVQYARQWVKLQALLELQNPALTSKEQDEFKHSWEALVNHLVREKDPVLRTNKKVQDPSKLSAFKIEAGSKQNVRMHFSYDQSKIFEGTLAQKAVEMQKMQEQVHEAVLVAVNEYDKGSQTNPIDISFKDNELKQPEIALTVLIALKKLAMTQCIKFYVKDPLTQQKVIITPEASCSEDEKSIFSYYANAKQVYHGKIQKSAGKMLNLDPNNISAYFEPFEQMQQHQPGGPAMDSIGKQYAVQRNETVKMLKH